MRLVRNPIFWLVLQLVVTLGVLAWTGGLEYQRHPDTQSYLNLSKAETLSEALSHRRTLGYPLFLKAVTSLGSWLEPVPTVQVGIYFASLLLFWWSLKQLSGSGWLAWAAVLPLPWAGVMSLAAVVLPDFLASAAAVVARSVLFLLLSETSGRRSIWWAGLGVSVFCAYQLRPAAVFLIAFIPLLGLGVEWFRGERGGKTLLRWTAGLVLVTLLPFLTFCSWRWLAVGHFGVVSFGGLNQAGMAANFLDGELVRELPREHRRLARNMLRMRRERGWETMTAGSAVDEHFAQYSDNIWRIALQAGMREYDRVASLPEGHPERIEGMGRPRRVVQNEILSRASKAIVRLRPHLYLKWVRGALIYGLDQLSNYLWIVGPVVGLMLSMPIFLLATRPSPGSAVDLDSTIFSTLIGLLALGVGYFAAYLLLVSLVSFPFTRYFVSLTLFLPSALCVQLYVVWSRILCFAVRPEQSA